MKRPTLLALQLAVGLVMLLVWHVLTTVPIGGRKLLDPFFFSTPLDVLARVWKDFYAGTIWRHLGITLLETVLAFVFGSVGGIVFGFVFARGELIAAVFDPYIKAANALPRVVLAPIFALWFSPTILANARMLGMNERQLLRHVYWPAALTWMFSSLHTAVGFALVGAVVGEYLGSAAGLGYKIHEAESVFDVTGVFAGMMILAVFVIVIDAVVTAIEKRLLVWRPGTQSTTTQG